MLKLLIASNSSLLNVVIPLISPNQGGRKLKKVFSIFMVIYASLYAVDPHSSSHKSQKYLPLLQDKIPITVGANSNPIGLSLIGGIRNDIYRLSNVYGTLGGSILPFTLPIGSYPALFDQSAQKWQFSEGKIYIQTKNIGIKIDAQIFPFMQIFISGTYLNMIQNSNLGDVNIPISQNLNSDQLKYYSSVLQAFGVSLSDTSATFHIGKVQTEFKGWLTMGGANFIYDYNGIFVSCIIAGGYIMLNDTTNNIKNHIQHPFMYIAPRIGYSYLGIMDTYLGIQRIDFFGKKTNNPLNTTTNNLAQSYSANMTKFPIDFTIGTHFTPIKEFSISIEYIVSPDTKGLTTEVTYRF